MNAQNDCINMQVVGEAIRKDCGADPHPEANQGLSRRLFLQGMGTASFAVADALSGGPQSPLARPASVLEQPFPRGTALRVRPILVFDVPIRKDRASWRNYGGINTVESARAEGDRIEKELHELKTRADFPIELQAVELMDSQAKLKQVVPGDTDLFVVYAAGFCTEWQLKTPMIMFVRHRTAPFYLGYEIAHWRFLRQNGDLFALKGFDTDDVIVDSYDEMLWRLRALYGLKNARGTKMLTVGGLSAYSNEAQENGPRVAREAWGYEFVDVTNEEFARRLAAARSDPGVVRKIEAQTGELLNLPSVKLETERKYVFNSYMALHVCRQLLNETGASNFGFSQCMGHDQISMLDTPPCFVLSLANDEGYTAYCHTDLSHTMPGVLLRWTASRPTFVCNSHYPNDGLFLVAHCQAPRRMNGQNYEPATIMTHYESDYGAACKTHYTKGQVVTVIIPNLRCTKWQGFRGTIVGSPSYPACRSQMEISVDGDWRRLTREMEGFHAQIVYGDYTREVGYALKKLGSRIRWDCFS
jgi:hypothetical protein